jgi:ketosteroid isomerase-like protein
VRPWIILVAAGACGGASKPVTAPAPQPAWVYGFAQNSKLGPVVATRERVITCPDQPPWPDETVGLPVLVAGTLALRSHPPLPVGPGGERSAGAEGAETTLAPCTPPPEGDEGLLAAEHAIFDALARRDAASLAALVAPDFVLHVEDQPDVDKKALLDQAAAIPGEILSVAGDGLAAYPRGSIGIVRGTQVSRLRVDGQEVEARVHFLDVFEKRDGRWLVTRAYYTAAR